MNKRHPIRPIGLTYLMLATVTIDFEVPNPWRLLLLISILLIGGRFVIHPKTYRVAALFAEWRQITRRDAIVVSDSSFQKDRELRTLFGQLAKRTYRTVITVYSAVLIVSATAYYFDIRPIADWLFSVGVTAVFLLWTLLYLLSASESLSRHIVRSYILLQLLVSVGLIIGLFISGWVVTDLTFNTFILSYIIANTVVLSAFIYFMPNYRLRYLANFTSTFNAISTIVLFFVGIFGNRITHILAKALASLNNDSPSGWQEYVIQQILPNLRTFISMISIVFLIGGSMIAIVVAIRRIRSERDLEKWLLNFKAPITPQDYHSLQRIVVNGNRTSNLFLATPAVHQAILDYERTQK